MLKDVKVFAMLPSEKLQTSHNTHTSQNSNGNPQIYNDLDFYQTLLKDFLATNDGNSASHNHNTASGNQDDDDDIYVDGADLGMTQRFLEQRRKLRET